MFREGYSSLPDELVLKILASLAQPELKNAAQVCRKWHKVAQDPTLFRMYQATHDDCYSLVCDLSQVKYRKLERLSLNARIRASGLTDTFQKIGLYCPRLTTLDVSHGGEEQVGLLNFAADIDTMNSIWVAWPLSAGSPSSLCRIIDLCVAMGDKLTDIRILISDLCDRRVFDLGFLLTILAGKCRSVRTLCILNDNQENWNGCEYSAYSLTLSRDLFSVIDNYPHLERFSILGLPDSVADATTKHITELWTCGHLDNLMRLEVSEGSVAPLDKKVLVQAGILHELSLQEATQAVFHR